MKTRKLRLLSALLALAMLLALLPTAAFATDTVYGTVFPNGNCGKDGSDVKWELIGDTLTISGTGAMKDYNFYGERSPWDSMKTQITKVVIGSKVTSIGSRAFQDCTNLKNVTFPSSIETIEKWAFYGCVALESVDLSHLNDLEQIKNNAFNNCAALKTVELPQNGKLNTIGVDAFSFTDGQPAPQITEITIPASVTTIGDGAFEGCSKLKKVTFAPDSQLKTVGKKKKTFDRCHDNLIICYSNESVKTALTSAGVSPDIIKPAKPTVTFDFDNGTEAENKQVENGEKVTPPTAPTKNGYIFAGWYTKDKNENWAENQFDFINTAIMDNMTLYAKWTPGGPCGVGGKLTWTLDGGTLTISGSGAMKDYDFYDGESSPWDSKKTQIQKVVIGDGVTSIGKDAFNECTNLGTVDLSNATSLEKIGIRAFLRCSQLKNVDLSKAANLEKFGDNAFNSSGVENVTFPQNSQLTEIGSGVFAYCNNLKNIEIPETVTKIGGSAFEQTNLTSIKIPASVTDIGWFAFYQCRQLESVTFAPDSKLEAIGGDAFSGCSALKTISCESALKEKLSGMVDETKVKIIVTHWNVSFVIDANTTTEQVENNQTVDKPARAPAKDGYIFAGWYTKDANDKWADKPFDFSKAITDDTTLYARWGVEATPITPATRLYPITIDYGTAYDAEGNPIEKAAAGDVVTIEASETALDGMVFERWEVRKGEVTLENDRAAKTSFTMPEGEVQLEAMYQAADVEDSGWDAATVVTGVAVGTGTAVLAYHIGMEVYAEQVLGKDVAVPRTRAEVALLAWQLAGSPAVNVEGEPLSEAAQAERWAVESGLMQKDAEGNFNGTKKMSKWNALRTLDSAKKLG